LSLPASAIEAPRIGSREFEATFASRKVYSDPFNDIDVDVIFSKDGQSWRVPTFWRGGNEWTVRFTPPSPGEYTLVLKSTDEENVDLNGQEQTVVIGPYDGYNTLITHGPLRVSKDQRHFVYQDGTPFFWLGDGLYTGLSDRISWEGFQRLISNRVNKGFTVAEVAAGLTCENEELAPIDPGFRNEGGPAWDPDFKQINPNYFDFADRRIRYVIDAGLMPAIIGAWTQALEQMGVARMKKHWRYLIARYGAYPVVWILGGEIYDPPENRRGHGTTTLRPEKGWTDVARYIRAIDPYHRLLTAHQLPSPYNTPLQDESLIDFRLLQPGHLGWASVALEVAELNTGWARTGIKKPLVVGEVGYEGIGKEHYEDLQRAAFWLAMLNGAAGYSYGTVETASGYDTNKSFHRVKYSFRTWEEAMDLPGSYQVGINARLLMQFPWWQFEPHPEWVTPRGTTLLERRTTEPFLGDWYSLVPRSADPAVPKKIHGFPAGEWKEKNGDIFLPYAAGISNIVRVVYLPYFGILNDNIRPPTILGLERNVKYDAYYWEPSLGIKVDLGTVENGSPGLLIAADNFEDSRKWLVAKTNSGADASGQDVPKADRRVINIFKGVTRADCVLSVDIPGNADAALILRYKDSNNYIAAVYSAIKHRIYLLNRKGGSDGGELGATPVHVVSQSIRLSAEVRNGVAAATVAANGRNDYSTPVIDVELSDAGGVGVSHGEGISIREFSNFELHENPVLVEDHALERKLYDAKGAFRGELVGPGFPPGYSEDESGWDSYGKRKNVLLGAYRPERLPFPGDWVLVLANRN